MMRCRFPVFVLCTFLAIGGMGQRFVLAQDFFDDLEDFNPELAPGPMDAAPPTDAAMPATDTADATAGVSADAPATPAELAAVVEAIQASEPTSAEELLRAIDQLIRLEQPAIAKPYLDQLTSLGLDQLELARLHQQFGTATFLRLARQVELAPLSGEFATGVFQAMQSVLRDPGRLQDWVAQLGADDKRVQYQAAEQLLRAGPYAVAPLLRGMVDAGDNNQLRRHGLSILRSLGDAALGPVLAMRESEDARTRATAITALGVLGSRRNLVHLVSPLLAGDVTQQERQAAEIAWRRLSGGLPSFDEAVALLADESARAYRGNLRARTDVDDQVNVWLWDRVEQRPRERRLPRSQASVVDAARLYQDLLRLRPDQPDTRTRALVAQMAVEQIMQGLDATVSTPVGLPPAFGSELTAWQLNDALDLALADNIEPAILALVEQYQDPTTAAIALAPRHERPAPLVLALTHPSPRVRWAAARTLARLDPYGKFAGASRVVDNLTFAARARGVNRAVVAHPNRTFSRNLAGMLTAAGIEATAVTNAQDLLAASTASPDIEIVLLSNSMNEWTWWSLAQELRANPLTAGLPLVVLARPETIDQARTLADQQDGVIVVSESLSAEDLRLQLPRIWEAAQYRIAPERRFEMGVAAVESLASLLGKDHPLNVELLGDDAAMIAAMDVPEMIGPATAALARIADRVAQTVLLDTASAAARPLADRRKAAEAFAASVNRHGVLLSSRQVEQQYDRYNASRTLDRDTQQLLGKILDTIEQADAARAGTLDESAASATSP